MAKANTKKQNNHVKTWADIDGVMRVYPQEFGNKKNSYMVFSTTVSHKYENGDYTNLYYNVNFKKNEAPEAEHAEAFYINAKKGFLTVRVDKKGNTHPAVMVLDYDLVEDEEAESLPF